MVAGSEAARFQELSQTLTQARGVYALALIVCALSPATISPCPAMRARHPPAEPSGCSAPRGSGAKPSGGGSSSCGPGERRRRPGRHRRRRFHVHQPLKPGFRRGLIWGGTMWVAFWVAFACFGVSGRGLWRKSHVLSHALPAVWFLLRPCAVIVPRFLRDCVLRCLRRVSAVPRM